MSDAPDSFSVNDEDLLLLAEREALSAAELTEATAKLRELTAWIDATVNKLKVLGKTVVSAALNGALTALGGPAGSAVEKFVAKQAAALIQKAQKKFA